LEKILITGANGYLGSNLTPVLADLGYELHLLARTPIKTKEKTYLVDLNDPELLAETVRKINPNIVIHLAATGFQYSANQTLDELIKTNFQSTYVLCKACQTLPRFERFIYPTTYMECQGSTVPIKITDSVVPQSEYALSKSLATNLLVYLKKSKMDNVVFRLFSVYGLNDQPYRFIPSLFDAMLNDKVVETTSLEQKRDFVYVKDVADLFVRAVKIGTPNQGLYNVGAGKPIKLADVAAKISALFPNSKGKIKIGAKPDRPNEAPCYYADVSQTIADFNWKPKYGLDAGLKDTFEFLTR